MTFLSALMLGLLASAHCAGMCGGLQLALQSGNTHELSIWSKREALSHLLLMNIGRISTYVFAGVLFSLIGAATLTGLNIPDTSRWLRLITGVVVFLIGLQMLSGTQRPFAFIEPFGAALWRSASKLIKHNGNRKRQSFITGMAWGFLPCGLVYSVLLSTVFSSDIWASAQIMLGFGLGTIPALVFTGLLYQRFKKLISNRSLQRTGGAFFMLGGTLIVSAPYWINVEFTYDYPQLLNLAFCVT